MAEIDDNLNANLIAQHRLNAKLELMCEIQERFPLKLGVKHQVITPYELHTFIIDKLKEEQLTAATTEILNPIT